MGVLGCPPRPDVTPCGSSECPRFGLGVYPGWLVDRSNGLFVQDVTPENVYRAVYEAFPVTLLPDWAGWLTKRLRQQGWLVDLDGVGMKAGVIRATTGGLDRLVADDVRSGALRILCLP